MVKLKNANITKYGSVQVHDDDIELFAYDQLKDYKKGYFKEPKALDIDDFVEYYLGRKVLYYQLSTKDSPKRILGSTAITDGKIAIINEDGIPEVKIFTKSTICIDEDACECETRRRFTLAHEAWHSQFDLNLNKELLDGTDSIKDTYIIIASSMSTVKAKTPKEWIEYHANKYAVFLLMPKRFVNFLFRKYHKEYFEGKRRLSSHRPQRAWLMIKAIANELTVSKETMAYRLLELKLISYDVFKSLKINKGKEENEML